MDSAMSTLLASSSRIVRSTVDRRRRIVSAFSAAQTERERTEKLLILGLERSKSLLNLLPTALEHAGILLSLSKSVV